MTPCFDWKLSLFFKGFWHPKRAGGLSPGSRLILSEDSSSWRRRISPWLFSLEELWPILEVMQPPFALGLLLSVSCFTWGQKPQTQTQRRRSFFGCFWKKEFYRNFYLYISPKKGNCFSLTDFIKITQKTKAGGPFDFYRSNFFRRCCWYRHFLDLSF